MMVHCCVWLVFHNFSCFFSFHYRGYTELTKLLHKRAEKDTDKDKESFENFGEKKE